MQGNTIWENNFKKCSVQFSRSVMSDSLRSHKLQKILKEMGIPNNLTCLLINLYAGQEVTVRTEDGTKDWFQIGKGVRQDYILSPCLFNLYAEFSSVQSLSRVQFFVTPWIAAHQASLSITNSHSSLKLTSIKSVMPSSHLILGHPLLLLTPIPPSIRVFSNESTLCMRWPKYWSFSFSIIPSEEIPGLISFRMDWLDLLAVQGTLRSLLQQHSSNASIPQRSAFFTVQLSHPYIRKVPWYGPSHSRGHTTGRV